MQYKEEWFNEALSKRLDDQNKVVTDKEHGFFARRTGSLSVGVTTKLYGSFNPNAGRLRSIRHVLTPTVHFRYTPDFSSPAFGYFASYKDTSGQEVIYDRFANSLFGGTNRSVVKSMSMSLANLVQVKTLSGETENKFDLLNINMSTSYNFVAPEGSRKLSDLFTSYRIVKIANLTLNTIHSFYAWDPENKRRTNTFLFKKRKTWGLGRFIQLTSLSASASFNLKSRQQDGQKTGQQAEEADAFDDELAVNRAAGSDQQERFEDQNTLDLQIIPWELKTLFAFRISRFDPANVTKVLTSSADLKIKVTDNWNVGYRGHFDLMEKSITSQDFSIYRDLHCWEFRFNWTPSNSSRAGYWLEIRVKDPKLSDLKIKRTDYGGSALGFR